MGARWEDAPRRPGGTIRGIDDKTKARYEWGAGRDTQVPAWVADYWAARLRLAEDPDARAKVIAAALSDGIELPDPD